MDTNSAVRRCYLCETCLKRSTGCSKYFCEYVCMWKTKKKRGQLRYTFLSCSTPHNGHDLDMYAQKRRLVAVAATMLRKALATARTPSNTGMLQMITYVKRHPNYTCEEIWQYWEEQHAPKVVPLATHFNISRYQQIQVGGLVPPTEGGSEVPDPSNLVEFDGIAMFLYTSQNVVTEMLAHPYYVEVVELDEHVFIDKAAFGAGMVATYTGTHIEAVDQARDVWADDDETRQVYADLFEQYIQSQ